MNNRIDWYVNKLSDILYRKSNNITKESLDDILHPYYSFFDTDILCLDNYAFLKVIMNDNQKKFDLIRSNIPSGYSEDLSATKSLIPDNLLKISADQLESICKYGSIFNSTKNLPRLPNRSLCTNYGKQFRNTISILFFKFDFLSSYPKFTTSTATTATTATTSSTASTVSTDSTDTTATIKKPLADVRNDNMDTNSQVIVIDEEDEAAKSLVSLTSVNSDNIPTDPMNDIKVTSKSSLGKRGTFKYHNTLFYSSSDNVRPKRTCKIPKTSEQFISVKSYDRFTDQTLNVSKLNAIVTPRISSNSMDITNNNFHSTTGIKVSPTSNCRPIRNTFNFSSIFSDSPVSVSGNS